MMVDAKTVAELRAKTGAGMMDCKKALSETNGDINAAIDYLREKGIAKAAKKESRIAAEGLANVYINGNKAVILEVNSETDFVSKNEEFTSMLDTIGNTILNSNAKTVEEALELPCEEGTIKDLIIAKTAKIGEKLSLRRIEVVEKTDDETFGSYLHMGGKIAVLTVLTGANEEVAKDVAMQAAAMKPEFVREDEIPTDRVEKERAIFKEQAMNEGKPAEIAEKMVEGRLKKFFKEICLVSQSFIKNGDIDVATYVKNNGGEVKSMIRYEVGEGMEKRNDNFAEEVMNQVK
ncbi:MAG: elongation factor Ts [Bacilli bacterium]|nr:elongation factor Ts [Bacilli bacterium]MCI6932435.1 translation elongation factor Ts [Mycoplasmatota bacterium]